MASWTYYTAFLDGTRPITKAERDELYTNLDVQLAICSATLSLNATDQAAITASGLLTDRASLDNSATPSNTRDRLHSILEAASGAWTNYSSVVSAALGDEGLTSTTRDAILASQLDDHRLWNYYKRVIDGLACACDAELNDSGFSGTTTSNNFCFRSTATPPCTGGVSAGQIFYYKFAALGSSTTFKLFVDDVEVYSTGAISGTSVCGSYTLPEGAETFKVQVIGDSGAVWFYTVRCSGPLSC